MPIKDTLEFGRLFVVFKVKFPETGDLNAEQITALEAVLGPLWDVVDKRSLCVEVKLFN